MSHVELPRPLEDYFAHAELDAAADVRRFTITLPYFNGQRLDRLQWWWSMTAAQLRSGGVEGLLQGRRTATVRFRLHIEHWLTNNLLELRGDGPIPTLQPVHRPAADHHASGRSPEVADPVAEPLADTLPPLSASA